MSQVTVLGIFVADISFLGDKIPSVGETIIGKKYNIGPGGKGCNQAIAIARLGGKVNFISKIREKRKANNISKNSRFFREQIQGPITNADAIMQKNGIVAVGDVSNTDYSFSVKKKSKIL